MKNCKKKKKKLWICWGFSFFFFLAYKNWILINQKNVSFICWYILHLTLICNVVMPSLSVTEIMKELPSYFFISAEISVESSFLLNLKKRGAYPSSPVVKNPPSNARDVGLIPDQETKTPHVMGQLSPCTPTREPIHLNDWAPVLQQRPEHSQEKKKDHTPWSSGIYLGDARMV